MNFVLGGKITAKLATLGPKSYSYLTDDNEANKKTEGTLRRVIKREHKFEYFKHCLEAIHLKNKVDANSLRKSHKEFI